MTEAIELLSADAVTALAETCQAIAAAGEISELELLSGLTDAQKRQVWRELPLQTKETLAAMKRAADERKAKEEARAAQVAEVDYLELLAKVQVDLRCIRDLHVHNWDGDRILAFAKELAVRSRQLEDRKSPEEAKQAIEWAMLNACIKRMDVGALKQLSAKVGEWHDELRGAR